MQGACVVFCWFKYTSEEAEAEEEEAPPRRIVYSFKERCKTASNTSATAPISRYGAISNFQPTKLRMLYSRISRQRQRERPDVGRHDAQGWWSRAPQVEQCQKCLNTLRSSSRHFIAPSKNTTTCFFFFFFKGARESED